MEPLITNVTRRLWLIAAVGVVGIGIACGQDDSDLDTLADWHLRWDRTWIVANQDQKALLVELQGLPDSGKVGLGKVRYEQYVRAHRLAYEARLLADQLERDVYNALEPYEEQFEERLFFCESVASPSPDSFFSDALFGDGHGWAILAESGITREYVRRVCSVESLARRQLIAVRTTAELNWLATPIAELAEDGLQTRQRLGDLDKPSATADPFPVDEADWIEGDIGVRQTSVRCPLCRSVRVLAVLDGSTLSTTVRDDSSPPSSSPQDDEGVRTIRLYGVESPQRGEPCYGTAHDMLEKYASDTVRVQRSERKVDEQGRALYYVFTERGNSIDEILIRSGLTRASRRPGVYADSLLAAESTAPKDKSVCNSSRP